MKALSPIAGYNLAAEYYDKREKYLNSFEQGKVIELLGHVQGKKILDVGAGTGRLSIPLHKMGAQVMAVDSSEEMLKMMQKKCVGISSCVSTVVADAEDLPFENNLFDVVVATFLVVHLKDPSRFFDEVYRVLKDGGKFLVTNINQKQPPLVKTRQGEIVIKSYYHRPERVRHWLEALAFNIELEFFIRDGENWINQILVAKK